MAVCLCIATAALSQTAVAKNFNFFGIDGNLSLNGTYSYAIRLESPSQNLINAPGRAEIPLPDALKFPESANFDDGNRNFEKWDTVNNRVTFFSQLKLSLNRTTGINITGDAFYDSVYHHLNANDSPETLNTFQQPTNSFTSQAAYYNGARARILNAYAYTTIYLGDKAALDIKLGRLIDAWGQSLYFGGVAQSQAPADASKVNVPGATVKSILLPTTQLALRLTYGPHLVFLGQWRLEYKHTELNPVGSFFSGADVVGPGAQFEYGLKNPLYLPNLSAFNLTSNKDLTQIANILDRFLTSKGLNTQNGLTNIINTVTTIKNQLQLGLPAVHIPNVGNLLNAPQAINVIRGHDIKPDKWDFRQWGAGVLYRFGYTTLGYYHLNYHSTSPTVRQKSGGPVLANPAGIPITGDQIGLNFPIAYNIVYFDNIKLDAVSFSTILFGGTFSGEFVRRDGVNVMVDVPSLLSGPIPTPTRATAYQGLLNSIYTFGPGLIWDRAVLVAALTYIYIGNVTPVASQATSNAGEEFHDLTQDRSAAAFATRLTFTNTNVYPGWDLSVPITLMGDLYGHSAFEGALGPLRGSHDYRLGVGVKFSWLQRLSLGLRYSGFLGSGDLEDRPLQDRDILSVFASYNFF